LRLPTSRTPNPASERRNSACRRETVTSSRKMSLSGCRPTVVTSLSSRKRLPAFGPRLTTSSALPVGSDSGATSPSSSTVSSAWSRPLREIVVVWSAACGGAAVGTVIAAPQRAQNRLSSGFCCPHWVQNTLAIRGAPSVGRYCPADCQPEVQGDPHARRHAGVGQPERPERPAATNREVEVEALRRVACVTLGW
jgi:hypothetical protein